MKKKIGFYIDKELSDDIDDFCKGLKINRTKLLTIILKNFMSDAKNYYTKKLYKGE